MAAFRDSFLTLLLVESYLDMLDFLIVKMRYAFKVAIVMTPWLASMYLLYWLGKHEIWAPETAHRDKITIAIVAAGMALSFLLQSYFTRRDNK